MKKFSLFLSITFIAVLWLYSNFTHKEYTDEGRSCTGVKLINEKWIVSPFAKDPDSKININETGVLIIQDAPDDGKSPGKKVSFKVSVQREKNFFNEAITEYGDKSVTEADLKTILKHCKAGDIIVLKVSESEKYDPKIQRIKVVGGC